MESPLLLPTTRPVVFLLVVLLGTADVRVDAFVSSATILPDHRSTSHRVASSSAAAALAAATAVPSNGSDSRQPAPPIRQLPNFLTPAECAQIRHWAEQAMQDGADECDDYLNYRVNGSFRKDRIQRSKRFVVLATSNYSQ